MRLPTAEGSVKPPNDSRLHPLLPPHTPSIRSPSLTHHDRLRVIPLTPIQASARIHSPPARNRHRIRPQTIQLSLDSSLHLASRYLFKNPIRKNSYPLPFSTRTGLPLPLISRIRPRNLQRQHAPPQWRQNLARRMQARQMIRSEARKMDSQEHL